jgi:hypothetical protein
MKISRNQLHALIQEVVAESQSVLFEAPEDSLVGQEQTGDYTKDPEEYGAEAARKHLFHMGAQSQQLHDMLGGDEKLEPKIVGLINTAASSLEKAFKAITYDKQHPEGR